MPAAFPGSSVLPVFHPRVIAGYSTGVLDIDLGARRVLSVPSQLGCSVGCTFCISGNRPFVRSLSGLEILDLLETALSANPACNKPVELSFTGEGEPALNWKACAEACKLVRACYPKINSVRYCFSGLGAPQLLGKLEAAGLPMRLQFSLHTARQSLRNQLVPRSAGLADIHSALRKHQPRFASVDLNVVLQAGLNDTLDDVNSLLAWADPSWRIVLNPLLTQSASTLSPNASEFMASLKAAGRSVVQYRAVADRITSAAVYPLLAASALPIRPSETKGTNHMETSENSGLLRLRLALRGVGDKTQVAFALGIQDPDTQTEEFWQGQKRAARKRFFQLCLSRLRLDESSDPEDLNDDTCNTVAELAEDLLAQPGFDYALVRRWFRTVGQFQHNKAINLARERNFLKDSVLRVLVVLNGGGAKYLAFGPEPDAARLVPEVEAHEFQVYSVSELEKPYLQEMAKHFSVLVERFDAKEIKVLQGAAFSRK